MIYPGTVVPSTGIVPSPGIYRFIFKTPNGDWIFRTRRPGPVPRVTLPASQLAYINEPGFRLVDTLTVSNVGVGNVAVDLTSTGRSWLTLSSPSVTVGPRAARALPLTIDMSSLPSGNYRDTITVRLPGDAWNEPPSSSGFSTGPRIMTIPVAVDLYEHPLQTGSITAIGFVPNASAARLHDTRILAPGREELLGYGGNGILMRVDVSTLWASPVATGVGSWLVDAKYGPDGSVYWLRDSLSGTSVTTSHGSVRRISPTGETTQLGAAISSPRGLVVASDGTIYLRSGVQVYRKRPADTDFTVVATLPAGSTGLMANPSDGGLYFLGSSKTLGRFDPVDLSVRMSTVPITGATALAGIDGNGVVYVSGSVGRMIATDIQGNVLSSRLLFRNATGMVIGRQAVYTINLPSFASYALTPP